jgi:hypothetical protein
MLAVENKGRSIVTCSGHYTCAAPPRGPWHSRTIPKFWPPKQQVPLLRFSSPSGMRSSGRDDNFAKGYSAGENALGGCRKNRPGRKKPATSSKMCPRLGARGDSLDDHLGFRLRWPSVVLLIQNRLPVPTQRLQQVAVGLDHLVEAADVSVHVASAQSDRRNMFLHIATKTLPLRPAAA